MTKKICIKKKLLEYFYFSVPENLRMEKEKEKENNKKLFKGKEKIDFILTYMKAKFPHYIKYLNANNINLRHILLSLTKQNFKFNNIAHINLDKESYLNYNNQIISNSLEFLFGCSKLFNSYIFEVLEEDEETETSNKSNINILPTDIHEDFKNLNEKYSNIDN